MNSKTFGFGTQSVVAFAASIISVLALLVFLLPGSVFAAGSVYVDASTSSVTHDGTSAHPFTTIQAAIDAASTTNGETIEVAAGTYTENVNVSKAVTIHGAGAAATKIVATNGNSSPVTFSTNGATVDGFTITHDYTPAELSAWNFNNNGVTFGQGTSGNTLSHSTVSLSRNGLYLNNASATIENNTITDNRTGINLTNTVDGTQITGNTISHNWTLGLVYYSQGTGTDFGSVSVTLNTFDQNWYEELTIKDAGTSHGVLNLNGNFFTDSPVTYTTSSSATWNEPGFAAQKPVELGGTAQKPATDLPSLRIYNSPSMSIDYSPKTLRVGASEPYSTISAALADATAGDTVSVDAGTYAGPVTITKNGISLIGNGSVTVTESTTDGFGYGMTVDNASGVTVSGITFDATALPSGYAFHAYHADNLTLNNLSFTGPGSTSVHHVGGVDINTSSHVTLNGVSSTGFYKNGFAVTAAYEVADLASAHITFNDISSTNNGWDGVAFYTIGGAGGASDITGVSFTGANTVSGNGQGGIFLEGDTDTNAINGVAPRFTVTTDGSTLDLTHVAFNQTGLFFDFDINNYQSAPVNAVGATFEGKTGDAMTSFERGAVDTYRINDQLDNAAYGLVTYYTPPAPSPVTVTIDAYVNGVQADTSNTAGIAFPMHAIFPGGEGDYTLSTSGYNNPDAYKATTSDMPVGSDYSTYQTDAAAANKCTAGYPFRLVGYGVGDTLADAQAAAPSPTVPSFTNLTSDKFVVAFFKTCPPAPTPITPATSGTTVTNAELPKIDWSDVSDSLGPVSSYNYEVSNAPDTGAFGSFNNIIYSASLTSSENPNGGTPDGTYYWHEQAVDAAGHVGPWSPTMSITFHSGVTPPAGPSVPTNGAPNGTTLNTNEFDFTWDASTGTGPITYVFHSSLNPAETNGVLTTGLWTSGTLTSPMIHSTGASDGTWYWQVQATDSAGNKSDWSPIWTVTLDHSTTTPDTTAPVVTVTPAAGSTLSGTVTFTITVTDNKPLDPSKLTHIWTYLYDNAGAQKSKGANVDLSSGTGTFTVDTTLLDDGAATLDVGKLFDAAGNPSGTGDSYFKNYQISNGTTTPPVTANVITNDATSVSSSDATLNGTIGSSDAAGHSFWVSSTTIDTSSPNIPADVYSTPDMGAASANSAFSALLSSLAATNGAVVSGGAQGTMPALVPGMTYHYVAWANVGGTWYPGAEKTVTLSEGSSTPTGPGHGAAPSANAQSITLNQDASTTITFSGSDPEGDSLTYSIATPPAHGSLSAVTGTDVTYTPTAGYSGSDSFTFMSNDGSSNSAPATISITVNAAPHAPVTPSTLVVTPSAPQGWSTYGLTASGTVDFIAASDSPSAPGALELTTSNDVNSVTHFKKEASSTLSDITSISYATKQISAADATNGNATLRLSIDLDGNGTEDDQLMYEPYYNGFAGGTDWNTWTITHSNGKFWSNSAMTYNGLGGVSAGSYASNFTLADVLQDHPNAKLIGLIVSMGSYNVSQQVAVDNVHLVTSTEDTTYNFEQDPASITTGTGGGSGSGSTSSRSRSNGQSTTSSGSTGSTGTGSTGGQVLGAAAFNFTRDLHFGLTGADVTELQTELIAAGYLHITKTTGWFGSLTRAAVAKWQSEHGIFPAAGYFGPISRAKYAADGGFLLMTTPVTTTTSTTTATTTPSV